MSWIAVAVGAGTALAGYAGSRQAASASRDASERAADAQMAGLEYMQEAERLPMAYRDQALGLLAQEFGLSPVLDSEYGYGDGGRPITGYESISQANPEYAELQNRIAAERNPRRRVSLVAQLNAIPETIEVEQPIYGDVAQRGAPQAGPSITDLARRSPIYEAMLSNRQAGEEAIARGASATGGLRGGATIDDLTQYNTDLENQALLTSYQNILGGLSGLAQTPTMAPQIAQQYSNIGQTQALGGIASAQAMQQGYGAMAQGLGVAANAYFNRPQTTGAGFGGGGGAGFGGGGGI